jgi:hypothetical protein
MAVVDTILYDSGDITSPYLSALAMGDSIKKVVALATIGASDSATSTYHLACLPAQAIVVDILCANSAQAGTTDVDVGLFHSPNRVGNYLSATAVINANIFKDALSLASAHARGAEQSCMSDLSLANSVKRLWELAGASGPGSEATYDLVATVNTMGVSGGTALFLIKYMNV